VVQTEQVGASQLPRLELAPGGKTEPTSVEFRDASGKAIKTLTLGKKHMQGSGQDSAMDEMGGGGGYPDGRYVQVSGAVGAMSVISDPLTDVEPVAGRWLNKSFFKIEKPKSISVTFAEATNSWTLTRETEGGQWKLAEAKAEEKLDAGKSAGVTAPFGSPTLNDVAVGLTPEQSGLDKPSGEQNLPIPNINSVWKPITPSGTNTSFFDSSGQRDESIFSKDEKESLLKKLDHLFARLEEMESKSNQYAHAEVSLFILSGLFLLFGLETVRRIR
jgi:hypothetical protein